MNGDLIQTDIDRISKGVRGLMEKVHTAAEERGEENVRIDVWMAVGVLSWTADDGSEREDIVMFCESKRHHVKHGILQDAIISLNETPDRDDEDDD